MVSVRILSEEEQTGKTDLLDVESDEDVGESFRVESSSSLVCRRVVDNQEEEVLFE